jgi:uncharacterized protein (DUF2252 family)
VGVLRSQVDGNALNILSRKQSSYHPAAAPLQQKVSQKLNHQERVGIQQHKGLSCGPALLIYCDYVRIDVRDTISKSIYLEIQKCEPILCIHVYMAYIWM